MFPTAQAVRDQVAGLVRLAADGSGLAPGSVATLAEHLMALPEDGVGQRGGRSSVNPESLPLEYSVGASSTGLRHRLMGDPASLLADGLERHALAARALETLLPVAGAEALAPACEALLRHMVRTDAEGLRQYPTGSFWMGAQLGGPGLALFVTGRVPGREAWRCLDGWVGEALPDPGPARALLSTLADFAELAGVGLEGTSAADARLKLYWRLRQGRPLTRMGVPLFEHPAFGDALRVALADGAVSANGFLPDVSFSLADGAWVDAKVSLCGHCLVLPAGEWARRVSTLTGRFGLAPLPTERLLASGDATVSFLSFGLDVRERPRLNLYLKPRGVPRPAAAPVERQVA